MQTIFAPGFFSNAPVHVALIVGGIVAVVSSLVGIFTVIRGQSFAGHALSDIGTAGGSGALLVGLPTIYGFVVMNLAAAGVMELIGIRRPRGRDVATGIVLGASLGLAALFLYWDTTYSNTTGATINVLFGSIFTISVDGPGHRRTRCGHLGDNGRPLPTPVAHLGQLRPGRGPPVSRRDGSACATCSPSPWPSPCRR